MPNLYYHRMLEGFPQELYRSVSYAAGYSKRSFVLTTPDADDQVLIDPSEGMDLSFPELPLLNQQGLGPRPENVHVVDFDHAATWEQNRSRNRGLIERLGQKKFGWMHPFTGKSTVVHNLARELELEVRTAAPETTLWAEDKKTLLDLAHLAAVPPGFKVTDNADLLERWRQLRSRASFPGKAVIKAAQAASGITSTLIQNEEHLRCFTQAFDLAQLDGGVIEEWHASDGRSPSVNYFIYPDGRSKVLFISDQIFEDVETPFGQEGTRIYRGNRFPSTFSEEIQQQITRCTQPLVEALYARGYWGPVGFDTIIIDGAEVMVTEINPRITGPHFGWRPMKQLGLSCFSLQNEAVVKSTSFSTLQRALEPALYSPGASEGYVVHNFFPGKFIGVSMAREAAKMEQVKERVTELLRPLRPVA